MQCPNSFKKAQQAAAQNRRIGPKSYMTETDNTTAKITT